MTWINARPSWQLQNGLVRTLFRVFLVTSAVFLLLGGSLLGVMMLAQRAGWIPVRAWQAHLAAHASFQVYGFMVMLIMGMAFKMLKLPRFPLLLVGFGYAATLAGTLASAFQVPFWGPLLLSLGALPLVVFSWPFGAYLRTGSLWLVAAPWTGRPELVLWSFASLFALGFGQRMHPALLGQPAPPVWVRRAVWILWNAGLLAQTPGLLLVAAGLQIRGLSVYRHPVRRAARPWMPTALRIAYGWLVLACALAVIQAPPSLTRHVLATGYLMTLLLAMAWHLVPALARRPSLPGPVTVVGWWQLATGLRLGSQLLGWASLTALGGVLQLLALGFGSWQLGRRLGPAVPPAGTASPLPEAMPR